MSAKRAVVAAFTITVLSAGASSAATCNHGRVTGTDMCQGKSQITREASNFRFGFLPARHVSAFGTSGNEGGSGMRASMARHGMFRSALSVNTEETGDLRGEGGSPMRVTESDPTEPNGSDVVVGAEVPLPAAGFLLLAGLGGLAVVRRKR